MSEYELVHDGESIGSVTIDGGRVDANVDPDVEHAERVEQWVETYDGVQDMEIESGLQGDFPGASDDVDNRVWRPADDDLVRTLCKQTLDTISVEMRASSESASKQQQVEEVPDHAEHLPPDEEPPEDSQVIIGPRGGRYVVEEPVDEEPEDGVPEFDPAEVGPEEAAQILDGLVSEDLGADEDWSAEIDVDDVGVGEAVEFMDPMTFEFETGVVVGVDGNELAVMTPDGESEISVADLNRIYDPDEPEDDPRPEDDSEDEAEEEDEPGEEAEEAWFDEVDFESEFGAVVDEMYEGGRYEVGDDVVEIVDSTEERGVEYYQTDGGEMLAQIGDVVTEVIDASRVGRGNIEYIQFSDEVDLDDGWYHIGEDMTEGDDGELFVDFVDEDGEVHQVDGVAVEREGLIDRRHQPVGVDEIEPAMSGAYEEYDREYPEDPDLPDHLSTGEIADVVGDEQIQQIERGFGRVAELGVDERISGIGVFEPEEEGEEMTLGRYEPETGEVLINPEQMDQETLDGVSESFAVGESVEDMIVHEAMHAAHVDALEEEGWSIEEIEEELLRGELSESERQIMEEQVSDYAAANPLEVVAEVGTKITLGEEVSDEVLQIYERYGGPEL